MGCIFFYYKINKLKINTNIKKNETAKNNQNFIPQLVPKIMSFPKKNHKKPCKILVTFKIPQVFKIISDRPGIDS